MRRCGPVPIAVLLLLAGCQQASFTSVSGQAPGRHGSGRSGLDHSEHGRQAEPASPTHAPSGGGKAVFAELEHDFGQVAQGEKVQHVFKVRNDGKGVLHIKNVRGS